MTPETAVGPRNRAIIVIKTVGGLVRHACGWERQPAEVLNQGRLTWILYKDGLLPQNRAALLSGFNRIVFACRLSGTTCRKSVA